MYDSAARAPRGGRERRVGLGKPVVVRRDRRTAYRHSGGLLAGPIGFPKAHPSLPPGERAVKVRTETLLVLVVLALSPASGQTPKRGGILHAMQAEDLVPHAPVYNCARMQDVWLDR